MTVAPSLYDLLSDVMAELLAAPPFVLPPDSNGVATADGVKHWDAAMLDIAADAAAAAILGEEASAASEASPEKWVRSGSRMGGIVARTTTGGSGARESESGRPLRWRAQRAAYAEASACVRGVSWAAPEL